MSEDNQRSEETIFSTAVQMRSAAERSAYLDAACADEGDLRRRIDALLKAQLGLGDFMENLPAAGPTPFRLAGRVFRRAILEARQAITLWSRWTIPIVGESPMSELTRILAATARGQPEAARLLPLVYDELRQLAARKMAHESGTQTLQPTALVHEAWLRLGGDEQPTWENRTHFFCAAAEAMRRILIDRARRKQARRHGGGQQRLDADEVEIAAPMQEDELLAVNEALDRFSQHAPQKAELVKLRYFAGMGLKEAGQVLGISEPTAVRWWTYSKTWLYQAVQETRGPAKGC